MTKANIHTIAIFMMMLMIFGSSAAQDIGSEPIKTPAKQEKMAFKDRLFFGGNLGAQFGDYTFINIAPLVGLKINQRWSIGTQLTYSYVNIKYPNYRYNDHIFGGSLMSRYFVFKNFFLHAEYEVLNGKWDASGERFNVNSLFLGGGYLYRLTDRLGLGFSVLFNVIPSTYSPYRNPIITGGFTYGL